MQLPDIHDRNEATPFIEVCLGVHQRPLIPYNRLSLSRLPEFPDSERMWMIAQSC